MDRPMTSPWLPERRRALTAASVTLAASVVVLVLTRGGDRTWTGADAFTLALPVYLLAHLFVTAVVFA